MMPEKPANITAVQELVQASNEPIRPRGGGTKPALSNQPDGAILLEMRGLSGILAYEPEEFTFTALAGTAVADVAAALAENGQYLPFDPLLAEAGATLGGTVAANTSGSGRFRYGGVRDFILGISFVDGQGRLVRSGGQVVKNSAGFDLPKFFVGSLGRYGILVELSFKVFPRPQAFCTVQAAYTGLETALRATFRLAQSSLEMDAVDLVPQAGGCTLHLRLGGLASVLPDRAQRLHRFLKDETGSGETAVYAGDEEARLWQAANSLRWAPPEVAVVKIPLAPKQAPALDARLDGLLRRYTCAANVAWVAVTDTAALANALDELDLVGLQLRGPAAEPILGRCRGLPLAQRVKQALDPAATFGPAA
jgi:glycolate oxidase FAD binding subunit